VIYSKKLPELLLLKDDQQAHKIHLNIDKIYVMILPEMSPENIKKFFGDDTTVSDEAGIRAEITKTIKEQKQEYELQTAIDKLLEQAKGSLSVIIPASLKQRELESRIETLKQRMGGEEKYQEYLTKI
jgi:FKBP-type peptidyl-prolyl cis-trans isomerase (trigger factor)